MSEDTALRLWGEVEGWQDIKNLWRFFNNSHIPDSQDTAQLPGHQGTRNAVSGRWWQQRSRQIWYTGPCTTKNCALWEPANCLIFGSEKEWVLKVRPWSMRFILYFQRSHPFMGGPQAKNGCQRCCFICYLWDGYIFVRGFEISRWEEFQEELLLFWGLIISEPEHHWNQRPQYFHLGWISPWRFVF